MLSPAEWLECAFSQRHIFICLASLHRILQTLPPNCSTLESIPLDALDKPSRSALVMFSQHQADAVRIVQEQLESSSATEPDHALFSGLIGLLMSHIQQGAFGMWSAHLQGAKALLDRWGPASYTALAEEELFILVTVDIYHTTTTASRQLPAQTWDHHSGYLRKIKQFSSGAIHSLAPVPVELLTAVLLINMRRILSRDSHVPQHQGAQPYHGTAPAVLQLIHSFSPTNWLEMIMPDRHNEARGDDATDTVVVQSLSQQQWQGSWLSLAQCFQSATTLYLYLTKGPADQSDLSTEAMIQQRAESYTTLTESIAHLFTLRLENPAASRHHKFILWPMVIAGVEAVVTHRDDCQVNYICAYLRLLAYELGTLTMRQAALFLEDLAGEYRRRGPEYVYRDHDDWDEIFRYSAIFLL
ncbi:hypothetical protein PG999_010511 [Apiospora kogelbergensis]|uniref:Uncharacterized protein n=1 Tax=Apiospora kogelbergensis TaxID=1337665 RepID=A0AAW0QI08_9PEZI